MYSIILVSIELLKFIIFLGSASNKIKELHMTRRCRYGYKTPERTALDVLGSEVRKEKELQCPQGFSKEDMASSEEDIEDLVFERNVLPDRTGVFDLDFPESPKVSKGRGKRSNIANSSKIPNKMEREVTGISSGLHLSTEIGHTSKDNPTLDEQSESNELDIHGNIRPSGVSTSQSINPKPITSEDSDRDITDTETITVSVKSKSL